MGSLLKKIRISNYRNFEFAILTLENNSVLLGANNADKTTLLEATKLAFTNGNKISKEDIHVQQGEILSQEKVAFTDIYLEPMDTNEDVDLKVPVGELSTYGLILEKAQELGLTLNEKSGKVVPNE